MSDELPIFPKAESLFVDTGNILNWDRLKRKAFQPPNVEVLDTVGKVLTDWLSKQNKDEVQFMTELRCVNSKSPAMITPEQRETVKITVKLFVCSMEPEDIPNVLETIMSQLGVQQLDTVLLSLPPARLSTDTLRAFWRQLELQHASKRVHTLGASDLGKDLLESLWELAEVKPQVNQVNLDSCCVMPPELQELAKEKAVSLTSHSDPAELVPASALASTLTSSASSADASGWHSRYVARHVSMVKHRGIVHGRGYLLQAVRDSRARPKLE